MAQITYIDKEGKSATVEVSLKDAPFDDHGKPASLLAIAMKHGIFIEHACGGVCACSTCHVIVEKGKNFLSTNEEQEDDMLDNAPGLTLNSRLSCQAEVLRDDAEIVVRVPLLNRNLVSEHAKRE
ncbi:MAG: 2Fe-2S iron-sulfur cluster-binding protein [Planctomycetes bacterium]|nr:2Fe-2S iron-sulfur cluster-binding protein [Planctomycetota bacterium]NUQ34582.1 2Fe-2S iron-sulfur cluster binding domain-containing protein [Planctomycetaceae bacterium]